MGKILVAVDGSEHAGLAAAWAARAAAEANHSLTLICVYDVPAAEAMALSRHSREEVDEIVQRHLAPSFDKARAAISADVVADTLAAVGNPADEILALARSKGFDHIVLGSRGLSAIQGLLLGSVSEKVLRRAHCAVTIVR